MVMESVCHGTDKKTHFLGRLYSGHTLFFGSSKYCVENSRFLIPTVNVYSYIHNETILLSVMEVLSGIGEPVMLLTRIPGISNNGFKARTFDFSWAVEQTFTMHEWRPQFNHSTLTIVYSHSVVASVCTQIGHTGRITFSFSSKKRINWF